MVQKRLDNGTLTRRSKGILSPEVPTKSQVCRQPENPGGILRSPEGDSLTHFWDVHTHLVLWKNLGLEGGMVKFTNMNYYTQAGRRYLLWHYSLQMKKGYSSLTQSHRGSGRLEQQHRHGRREAGSHPRLGSRGSRILWGWEEDRRGAPSTTWFR